MYSQNGTYYNEEHSISFIKMDFAQRTFQTIANTWTDWFLIPSSRPVVAPPAVQIKMVEVPGSDSQLDLTDYLTGKPQLGLRSGSFSFIVDNGHQHWETIRMNIINTLHGKKLQMRLMDDPDYFYNGRFTVGNFEPGESHSTVTINYQLDPFKIKILYNQQDIRISNSTDRISLRYIGYPYTPWLRHVSGDPITGTFGGVTKTVSSLEPEWWAQLGTASGDINSMNLLTLTGTGTGTVRIIWEEGSL